MGGREGGGEVGEWGRGGGREGGIRRCFLSICSAVEGHHEQESTLNQLLVEMDGEWNSESLHKPWDVCICIYTYNCLGDVYIHV